MGHVPTNGIPFFKPNEYAEIVRRTWDDLSNYYRHIQLDEFIIMPNHVHGIIVIRDSVGAGLKPASTMDVGMGDITGLKSAPIGRHGLPEIIRAFKTFSARRINLVRNTPGVPVWQRNYYDHIIRDENSLYFIRKYIRENPANWESDGENHIDREIREFESVGANNHSPLQTAPNEQKHPSRNDFFTLIRSFS